MQNLWKKAITRVVGLTIHQQVPDILKTILCGAVQCGKHSLVRLRLPKMGDYCGRGIWISTITSYMTSESSPPGLQSTLAPPGGIFLITLPCNSEIGLIQALEMIGGWVTGTYTVHKVSFKTRDDGSLVPV